jgi:hypothetical protein
MVVRIIIVFFIGTGFEIFCVCECLNHNLETEKELTKLKDLFEMGFIQEEEYNRRKAEIMATDTKVNSQSQNISSNVIYLLYHLFCFCPFLTAQIKALNCGSKFIVINYDI